MRSGCWGKRLLCLVLALALGLGLAASVRAQALDQTYVDMHNPLLNGATCDSTTLQAALTALGTQDKKTLYLTATDRNKVACVWQITTNVTIPAHVSLLVPFGVTAVISSGVTLASTNCIRAEDPQWYSGAGTVTEGAVCDPTSQVGGLANTVQSGCYHSADGLIPHCVARVRTGTGFQAAMKSVRFPTPATLTYTAGDGDYYVLLRSTMTLIPAGWTCLATTPYCTIKASTKPALPPDTAFLMHVVRAAGVLTPYDITQRLVSFPTTLTQNTYIGADGIWEVQKEAQITIAADTILAIQGCLHAPLHHIFTGAGTVTYLAGSRCSTVYAEWWGAKGDGMTPGNEAKFTLASEALPLGGTILGGGPTAHYRFTAPWQIRQSHLTFDGQGSLLSGAPAVEGETLPVIFVTDGGGQEASGETAQFLHNVTLKNYRVGVEGTYPQDQMRGGVLQGCVNCMIDNVRVKTSRGTTFTLFRCESCTLRNIYIEHGSTTSSNFATLLVHSNNTLVDNWYARGLTDGTGPCCFMFQVKGGINNRIVNATLEDVTNPVVVGAKHAFFSRGDDPWSVSNTDPVANPYPFPTNPNAPVGQQDCKTNNCYLYPDQRRASADTRWTNITVRNAPGANCLTVQEAYGDHVIGFTGSQCRLGVQFNQAFSTGAGERDFILDTFHLRDIGLTATNGDGVYAVSVNGAGTESADDPDVATAAFRNIRISNGVIEGVAGPGVGIEDASAVVVTNVVVHNGALKAVDETDGFRVSGRARNVKLIGNTARDSQATPTMTHGFRILEQVRAPTLVDNTVDCTNCPFGTFHYFRAVPVGRYDNNSPAFCTARTTDALPEIQRCVLLTKDGDRFRIISSCAARQGATNRAYYERTAVVEDNSGVLTIYPNQGTGDTTFESHAAWDVTYAAVLEELRIRPQGAAGQTVDWWCDIQVIDMRQ